LTKCGVQGLADSEIDGPCALLSYLNDALSCGIAGEILTRLGNRLTPELTRMIHSVIGAAHNSEWSLTPDTAAKICCCHPKTLREHLRAAGLPPTHHLLVWLRLLHAAYLLRDPGRTVAGVAHALGYSSGAALTAQMARYAGVCPKKLRERGGMQFLLKAFPSRNAEEKGGLRTDRV
jgi:AraC-like DNA-binding protein